MTVILVELRVTNHIVGFMFHSVEFYSLMLDQVVANTVAGQDVDPQEFSRGMGHKTCLRFLRDPLPNTNSIIEEAECLCEHL